MQLLNRVDAAGRKGQPSLFQFNGNGSDTGSDGIFGGNNICESLMPQPCNKGAGGRVHNDEDIPPSAGKGEHIGGILRVVLLNRNAGFLTPAAVIEFAVNVVPDAVTDTGSDKVKENAGIEGAVVHGDEFPLPYKRSRIHHIAVFGEHGVDHAVRNRPFAQDKASGKDPGIHRAVFLQGCGRESEVVGHGEMFIIQPAFLPTVNPAGFEPMERTFRIAVEPPLRTLDRTTRRRLIDEGFRH